MIKNIKEMTGDEIENLPTLGLDDTFEFWCKACGKCCKNRKDILLTPFDTFRIAEFFGRTTQEIIERYCEVYEGGSSHMPVVRVLPVLPDNSCPFMRNRKCSVHAKKPVLCRVFPLARMYKDGDEALYYFNGSHCKAEPRTVTVREWIADVADEESEQAGKLWRDIISEVYPVIQPDKLKVSAETRQKIIGTLVGAFWVAYNMEKPFIPQLEENYAKIKILLEALKNETE